MSLPKINIGIIYRKANTWWDMNYLSSVLRTYHKCNYQLIDVTKFEKDKIPRNFEVITLLPFEADVIEDVLDQNKNCKWVHCMWSGVDKLLSKPKIMDHNIMLTNGRGAFSKSLAEFSIFSMLYFSYNMPTYHKVFQEKGWVKPLNKMINQKTLTIVGYGWNGVEIALKAKLAFNMKVIAIKKNINNVDGKLYIDELATLDKLKDILPRSDFVLSILPGTKETEDLWNEELFNLMKPSSVFINLGRGSSVKEEDLIKVLREKRISGASLDVYKQEPLPSNSEFYDLQNVLLSFHSCDNTDEYFKQGLEVFTNNLDIYEQSGRLLTVVDKLKGY